MASVVPGYDFSVDEVPTFGKFIAQAQGLELSGLEFSDLSDLTNYLFNGQASGGSGATQVDSTEGGMWVDTSGEVWVTTRVFGWWGSSGYSGSEYARVPLFKLWRGGWDTIRGNIGDDSNNFGKKHLRGDGTADAGYSPANLRRTTLYFDNETDGTADVGIVGDTPASGVFFVSTGRGGSRFHATGALDTANEDLPYRWAMTNTTNLNQRKVTNAGSTPPAFGLGEIYGLEADRVNDDGNGSGRVWAWYYGRALVEFE